jgi:hypothetical protein
MEFVAPCLVLFLWSLPFWLPVVWAAYAAGRRRFKFSVAELLILTTVEAVAIFAAINIPPLLVWPSARVVDSP